MSKFFKIDFGSSADEEEIMFHGKEILEGIDEDSFKPEPNIKRAVVLGGTGVGKSTFLNYLFLNQQESQKKSGGDLFKTSNTGNSCTKKIENYDYFYNRKRCKISFYDTPGLNEKNDFKNMYKLIKKMKKIKKLSCIIVIINGERLSTQQQNTLLFYSKLFKFMFYFGNVIIVKTKFSPDDFQFSKISMYKKNIKKMLNDKKFGNCFKKTGFIEVMNCKITSKFKIRIQMNQRIDTENIKENDLETYSWRVRKQIIDYIISCKPVDTRLLSFHLPPKIDLERKKIFEYIHNQITTAEKVSEWFEKEHSSIYKKLREIQFEILNKYHQIKKKKDKIKIYQLEEVVGRKLFVITPKHSRSSSYIFKKIKGLKYDKVHKQEGSGVDAKLSDKGNEMELMVTKKNDTEYHFVEVNEKKENKQENEKKIQKLNEEIKKIHFEITRLNQEKKNIFQSKIKGKAKIKSLYKKFQKNYNQLAIISKSSFNSDEIDDIDKIFKMYQKGGGKKKKLL